MKQLLTLSVLAALAGCATQATMDERPKVTERELDRITNVLKRDFHERGQAKLSRVELDEVQRACNLHGDNPPAELAKRLEDAQLKAINFPDGRLLGDWKKGERIAQRGR